MPAMANHLGAESNHMPVVLAMLLGAVPALLAAIIIGLVVTAVRHHPGPNVPPEKRAARIWWRTFGWTLLVTFVLFSGFLESIDFSGCRP
jgi:hypothetical protein